MCLQKNSNHDRLLWKLERSSSLHPLPASHSYITTPLPSKHGLWSLQAAYFFSTRGDSPFPFDKNGNTFRLLIGCWFSFVGSAETILSSTVKFRRCTECSLTAEIIKKPSTQQPEHRVMCDAFGAQCYITIQYYSLGYSKHGLLNYTFIYFILYYSWLLNRLFDYKSNSTKFVLRWKTGFLTGRI